MTDLRDSNLTQLNAQDNWSIKAKKKPIVESINYEQEMKENEAQDVELNKKLL